MTAKPRLAGTSEDSAFVARTPLWLRATSVLLLVVAAILVTLAFGKQVYASNLEFAAIGVVLFLQACASLVYARGWFAERKEKQADNLEFISLYRNVLDGIMILDDDGVCRDANPAAFAILGAPPAVLIGRSFAQFFRDPEEFARQWNAFLAASHERGRLELLRPDHSKVFVSYSVTAHYSPGRHAMILCDITGRVAAERSARESYDLYRQMADNINEVFWLLDAGTKEVLAVNRAYETITGRSLESIRRDPFSYEDLIHAADRAHVLAKLDEAVRSGQFDEEFRIVRPDGEIRWVWVKAHPMWMREKVLGQLYGTAQDVTLRKLADTRAAEHLVAAEAASAEAEALRKATLALTQDLRMDAVLDTLLRTISDIVPFETTSVLLTEENDRLFVAREAPPPVNRRPVVTLETKENPLARRVLCGKRSLYLSDTREEPEWRNDKAFAGIRSWIAVPLVVSGSVSGFLSIGSRQPHAFTARHFRLAKLLAIPAAVAIHNARLYEWAQIYAAEREGLLKKLGEAKPAADKDDAPPEPRPN